MGLYQNRIVIKVETSTLTNEMGKSDLRLTRIIFLLTVLLTFSPRTVSGFNAIVKYPTNAILFSENTRYVTD